MTERENRDIVMIHVRRRITDRDIGSVYRARLCCAQRYVLWGKIREAEPILPSG